MKTPYSSICMLVEGGLCCMLLICCAVEQTVTLNVSEHNRTRYEKIAPLLNQYQRPITILNIGATDSWLIITLAQAHDATVVIASRDINNELALMCSETDLKKLILLKKELSLAHLDRLSQCEHFDVTLIVDDFNALPLLRKAALLHVVSLGDYTIIEVPQSYKQKDNWTRAHEIRSYLLESGSSIINEIPIDEACLFIVHKPKKALLRAYWDKPQCANEGDYVITSTFTHKYLYKKATNSISTWHPGINLHTFKALSGVYPSYTFLHTKVKDFYDLAHNDFNPCNFIIQGHTLLPIDFNDPRRNVDHKIGYDRLLKLFCA